MRKYTLKMEIKIQHKYNNKQKLQKKHKTQTKISNEN